MRRAIRVSILSRKICIIVGTLFLLLICLEIHLAHLQFITNFTRPEPKPKAELYLTPSEMAAFYNSDSDALERLFSPRYDQYRSLIADFNTNISLTVTLCVIGFLALYKKEDFTIPLLSSIHVPVSVAYLVVPGALTYLWLKFGFILHHSIEARMALTNLTEVQARIALDQMHKGSLSLVSDEQILKVKYSMTRAVNIRDQGFLDCWFMFFQKEKFITASMTPSEKLVPAFVMICVGLLQGISHGFALALPVNWLRRWAGRPAWFIAMTLFGVNCLFIGLSHSSFYFTGRNDNWLSLVIIYSGLFTFLFLAKNFVCDLHKLKSSVRDNSVQDKKAAKTGLHRTENSSKNNEPNKAVEPTPMAVTDAATQSPRQP